jgi:hypothetical protein
MNIVLPSNVYNYIANMNNMAQFNFIDFDVLSKRYWPSFYKFKKETIDYYNDFNSNFFDNSLHFIIMLVAIINAIIFTFVIRALRNKNRK